MNSNHTGYNDLFVRSVHKCAANILCKYYGSRYTREWYPELIHFINTGDNPQKWSYAVAYQPSMTFHVRPHELSKMSLQEMAIGEAPLYNIDIALAFVDTSGIYFLGLMPNVLNKSLIEHASKSILQYGEKNEDKLGLSSNQLSRHFDSNIVSGRKTIGNLHFLWIKKQLKPNRDDYAELYVLVKCTICGQINPTKHAIDRIMLRSQTFGKTTVCSNNLGWNKLTIEDLKAQGRSVEKLGTLDITRLSQNNITYPTCSKNEMFPNDGTVQCINCKQFFRFTQNDCFL